jgi:hypothetical protein
MSTTSKIVGCVLEITSPEQLLVMLDLMARASRGSAVKEVRGMSSSIRLKFDLALGIAHSIQASIPHGQEARYEISRYRAEPGRADARWRSSVCEPVQAGG